MTVRLLALLSLVAAGCGGSSPEVVAPPRPGPPVMVEAPPPPEPVCADIPLPGSARIRWAQQNLNAIGYDCGPVDGLPGPRTEACVKTFQRTNLLQDTGYLDPETRRALACQI